MALQIHLTRFTGALLTIALLALVPAAGAAAEQSSRGLMYGGQTSQHGPFVLALRRGGGTVDHIALLADAKCSNGVPLRYYATLDFGGNVPSFIGEGHHFFSNDAVSGTGAFASTGLGAEGFGDESAAMIEKVKGKVRAGGAAGTYSATMDMFDKAGAKVASCHTGVLRWTARSSKGRVYAGSTSQDQPVVLELNRQRTKVTDILIGWGAGCTPSGSYELGEHLLNFPISDGAFGDTFSDVVKIDGGGKEKFDYSVKGRVGRTKASGRLSVRVDESDAAGATTATCKTGAVTWSAKTG